MVMFKWKLTLVLTIHSYNQVEFVLNDNRTEFVTVVNKTETVNDTMLKEGGKYTVSGIYTGIKDILGGYVWQHFTFCSH